MPELFITLSYFKIRV